MTIGQRIKKARLHRGLTQQELGLLVGFPKNSADVLLSSEIYAIISKLKSANVS